MAISYSGIQEGIIKTINTLVGKDADPTRTLFDSPVIQARQQGNKLDYPIVVVDKLPSAKWGNSAITSEYFNDDLEWVVETTYKVFFNITVYGSTSNDVQSIAQEIRDTLYRGYGKTILHENTCAGLLTITAPSFSFNYLETDYEEVSRITLEMSATSAFIETSGVSPTTSEIISIITDGELDHDNSREDDPNPITTQSTAP